MIKSLLLVYYKNREVVIRMDARNMYVHAVRNFPFKDVEAFNGKVEKNKFYTMDELYQMQKEYDESKKKENENK